MRKFFLKPFLLLLLLCAGFLYFAHGNSDNNPLENDLKIECVTHDNKEETCYTWQSELSEYNSKSTSNCKLARRKSGNHYEKCIHSHRFSRIGE